MKSGLKDCVDYVFIYSITIGEKMNKTGKKDFDGWIELKKQIHYRGSFRTIKEGEIWWCKIGENVGREICGKGKDFLRPVLIVYKLSKHDFIGIPLTSQKHVGSWYVEFIFKNKIEYAVLVQLENISVHRLHYKMGEVPSSDLDTVLSRLCQLLKQKISSSYRARTGGYPRKSNCIISYS